MNNSNDSRVLCRVGARELTAVEAESVNGAAALNTLVCTVLNPKTASHTGPDGDGCGHDNDFDF